MGTRAIILSLGYLEFGYKYLMRSIILSTSQMEQEHPFSRGSSVFSDETDIIDDVQLDWDFEYDEPLPEINDVDLDIDETDEDEDNDDDGDDVANIETPDSSSDWVMWVAPSPTPSLPDGPCDSSSWL